MAQDNAPSGDSSGALQLGVSQEFVRRKEPPLPAKIGPYRILRKIGAGGMGAVYEGVNDAIERRVAIKVLHPRYSHDPDTAMRFINEARAVNRIDHPGVVQVSDHGRMEDGSAYIVMELLQGESLSGRIHRSGALPAGECIDLIAQIAEALAAAHARSIIHRDLKPDNIMIVHDRMMPSGERTKVLDFGIAKLAKASEGANLKTQTSAVLGTPFYMSPEQAQGGRKVDDKTDVYSLGVILYEMLTGKPPFDGEGLGELLMKHMSEPPPPLPERLLASAKDLCALLLRMLEKDRDKRPTMLEVVEILERLRDSHPRPRRRLSQSMPLVRESSPQLEEPARPSTLGRASGQTQLQTKPRLLLAGVFGTAALGLIVVLVLSSRRPDPSRQAPPDLVTTPNAVTAPSEPPQVTPPRPPETTPPVPSPTVQPGSEDPEPGSTPRAGSTRSGSKVSSGKLSKSGSSRKVRAGSGKEPRSQKVIKRQPQIED